MSVPLRRGKAGVQAPLEAAMAELCLGPGVDFDDPAAVQAWLERHGVAEQDIEWVLQEDLDRLRVYRDLVRGNLWEAMRASIPRTMARMGPVFEEYFDRFLVERGPRTHYLKDAIAELLDFCLPAWRTDPRVPAYMADLARHEHAQILVGSQTSAKNAPESRELELDASLIYIEAVRLMRYGYAVHRLSERESDHTPPEKQPTAILVYRNPDHEVRYLDLSLTAALIIENTLVHRCTLREALHNACAEEQRSLDAAVLEGTASLLAELAERGALIGRAEG